MDVKYYIGWIQLAQCRAFVNTVMGRESTDQWRDGDFPKQGCPT
jgi:hypothetical protein